MVKRTSRDNKKQQQTGLLGLLKPYKGMVTVLIIVTLLGNAANLIVPLLIQRGIDSFNADNAGHYNQYNLVQSFLIIAFAILIFTYFQNIIQIFASEKVARDLRTKLADKISRQDYMFVQQNDPAKLLTNLTSDIDSIKNFVSHAIVSIVSSVFIIIGTCILLFRINTHLAWPVIAIIPVIGISFSFVLKKVRVLYTRSREVIDWLNRVISESIIGAAIIRVLNTQALEYNKFLNASTDSKNIGISILKLFAILIPIIMFTSNLAILVVLALGGKFVINGNMTFGDFAAFISYISILVFPIIIIGFMSNVVAQASASYKRIKAIFEKPDIIYAGTHTDIKGNIELKNVFLYYQEKPVLKDVSFTIEAGSQTAILGPTAAGKSQLLNLVTGLIKPDNGLVLIDGKTINDYEYNAFFNKVAAVFQDSVLFNLNLRENIAFGENIAEEDMFKAIETAELSDFINSLPNKLDTVISERGTSLSGGQKQRIMLARALALNPSVLLLDDFTARVDKQTENKIQCNLLNNYPNITLLTVSQKIASVKHFDHIILLMEGEIVAQGKHEELLAISPEYNQIYNSQLSTSHYEL